MYLQRPGTEPAIFRKSSIYKAHSLNESFSCSSEIVSNRCLLKDDNWKDMKKAQGEIFWLPRNLEFYSASLILSLKPIFLSSLLLFVPYLHLLTFESHLSPLTKAHGWKHTLSVPYCLLYDFCIPACTILQVHTLCLGHQTPRERIWFVSDKLDVSLEQEVVAGVGNRRGSCIVRSIAHPFSKRYEWGQFQKKKE